MSFPPRSVILACSLLIFSGCSTTYVVRIGNPGAKQQEILERLNVFYRAAGFFPWTDLPPSERDSWHNEMSRNRSLRGVWIGGPEDRRQHMIWIFEEQRPEFLIIRIVPQKGNYYAQRAAEQLAPRIAEQIAQYVTANIPGSEVAVLKEKGPDLR